jgi:hypothetical protein
VNRASFHFPAFARGIKLRSNSRYTVRLKRNNSNERITGKCVLLGETFQDFDAFLKSIFCPRHLIGNFHSCGELVQILKIRGGAAILII